jgi:hypothetical protein
MYAARRDAIDYLGQALTALTAFCAFTRPKIQ